MLEYLQSDPQFAVEVLLAVLGIALAVILYYRGTFIKQPCYLRRSARLVEPELTETKPIRVTFDGKPLTTLTMTHVVLWNNGRATIDGQDIASSDPLRIVAKDQCNILAADIVARTHAANCFRLELDGEGRDVAIDFDFIDYKNGVGVRVYHTGKGDQDIQILGTVKGAKALTDVTKATSILFYTIEHGAALLGDRLISLIPRRLQHWLVAALDTAYNSVSCQGLLLYMIIVIPMILVFLPVAILGLVVFIPVTIFVLLYSLYTILRYSVPKELGSLMRGS